MSTPTDSALQLAQSWSDLDDQIRGWWDGDMRSAAEADVCGEDSDWTWRETIATLASTAAEAPAAPTLLVLPFPFSPAAGDQGAFPEMFAWDTYFIVRGLLAHERYDLARNLLLNQLSMILRFGKLPNANRTYFLSRSQPPLHPDGIWRYYEATHDLDILLLSYPLLRREYTEYWNDGLHRTPTGLATNCDEGDPYLRPELASIAEAGHDFTPIFGPDIRRCTPLATNAQLVRYARVLGAMARTIGFKEDAERWTADAQERAAALRSVCWSDVDGYFFEYDWETGEQLPAWSLCAFWSLWADVASDAQAKRLVASIGRFEHDGLLTFTDRLYDNPFPELPTLQWSFPYSWPPLVTVVVEALWQHGFRAEATRVGANYLRHVLNVYEETGSLWEKYISADSGAEASIERYETAAFHGWTSASVAIIGRLIGLDTGPVASSR